MGNPDKNGTRRRFIKGGSVIALGSIAGCIGDDGDGDGGDGGDSTEKYEEITVSFGGSDEGTSIYSTHQTLSQVMNEETATTLQVQTSGGNRSTTRTVGSGSLDLGSSDSVALILASQGEGDFEQSYPVYQTIPVYTIDIFVICPEESEYQTFADLDGATVGGGGVGSSVGAQIELIMEYMDDPPDIELVDMSHDEQGRAIVDGRLDATGIYTVNGISLPPSYAEATRQRDLVGLPFPEDAVQGVLDNETGFLPQEITEDLMAVREPFVTPITPSISAASDQTPDAAVRAYTNAVFEFRDQLKENNDLWAGWTDSHSEDPLSLQPQEVPIHPETAKVYEEQGLWDDSYTTEL